MFILPVGCRFGVGCLFGLPFVICVLRVCGGDGADSLWFLWLFCYLISFVGLYCYD